MVNEWSHVKLEGPCLFWIWCICWSIVIRTLCPHGRNRKCLRSICRGTCRLDDRRIVRDGDINSFVWFEQCNFRKRLLQQLVEQYEVRASFRSFVRSSFRWYTRL